MSQIELPPVYREWEAGLHFEDISTIEIIESFTINTCKIRPTII